MQVQLSHKPRSAYSIFANFVMKFSTCAFLFAGIFNQFQNLRNCRIIKLFRCAHLKKSASIYTTADNLGTFCYFSRNRLLRSVQKYLQRMFPIQPHHREELSPPALMTISVPISTSSGSTCLSFPSSSIFAYSGQISIIALIDWRERLTA